MEITSRADDLTRRNAELRQDLEDEQPRYSRRDTLLTMLGVLLVMLLASLDQTIVSTAMPRIIADFQGFDRYTWVTTAYMLTSTVLVPIYGKLSDLFGRKWLFLCGVVLFLLGSAASGAAQSMNQLIIFRAFQGIGAAGLMPIAMAVVGDLFTPRERGKWQGVTGSVFGLSSIIGPLVGGWLTENLSWRWVFYVNLPIGLLAMIVLIFLMPALGSRAQRVSIDYIGAALLIIGTVPLLLGFTWAGSNYAWLSLQIIGLFALAIAALVVFIFYELALLRRGAEPIINPTLFKNRVFTTSVVITMIISMGMFGSIYFLPLFAQGVMRTSATASGLLLTPMMLSLVASSVISGQLVSRFGRYKWLANVGMGITVVGSLLLLRLNVNSVPLDLIVAMIIFGLGLGFGMSIYTLMVQNALPRQIGEATAALTFFRSIGGTIALAAMGSLMTSAYVPALHNALPDTVKRTVPNSVLTILDNPNVLLSADTQQKLLAQLASFGAQGRVIYDQLMEAVKLGLTQGLHNVFLLGTILIAIGFVLTFIIEEVPLRGSRTSSSSIEVDLSQPTADLSA